LSDPKRTVLRANKKEVSVALLDGGGLGFGDFSFKRQKSQNGWQIPAMEALIDRALELDESYAKVRFTPFSLRMR